MKRFLLAILVVLAAACTGGQATQYVGTVMHESAPDSAGSLRLTLYTRTDSAFSGVIELGPPARGTGGAYAWHEGGELHVVTIGAETADTIHWISPLTDDGLGGRFEVTGGDRAGQRGTWRARLVQGLPATPATLRLPMPFPAPRPTAFWPVLLLAGAGAWLARWIRRAPRPPVAADGTPWRAPPSRLAGIGGWLVLFVYGQVVGAILWVVRLRETGETYTGGIGFGAVLAGMQSLIVLETVFQLLTLPVALGGLVLLFRRSPLAPRYWFAYLVGSGVYMVVDLLVTPYVHAQSARLVGAEALAAASGGATTTTLMRQVIVTFVWALYWVRAERVRATFGAAALDRTVTIADPDAAPVATPARPRHSWRRVALWGVAGLVVAVGVTVAVGLFRTRATPWEVPGSTDIRATVAGRWTWASDSLGCRHAHTIAFANDGKVMTITSPDINEPEPIATYDIQVLSRSTIRGAIRGETRKTDDGKPVVWDLVLTSPDEYRWKRTDWSDSPWSYTGAITRCPGPAPDTTRAP